MSFTVNITINRNFEVRCPIDKVHEVLADVPRSVSHFPKVDQLVPLGDNTFRWEMEKIGIDRYYLQTVYACKYTSDQAEGWVKWVPVPGVGNGVVEGHWKCKSNGDRTHIDFYTKGDLTLPFPSLMKFLLAGFVTNEFNDLVDKYIVNLKKTFEG
jgi:hypothetical protein